MRAMLLGYDEDLCPDEKVIGDVANEKYQPYSEEEKKHFIADHKSQIKGKRQCAAQFLVEGDNMDKKIARVDNRGEAIN